MGKTIPMSPERRAEIEADVKAAFEADPGIKQTVLAVKHGVSRAFIGRAARKMGFKGTKASIPEARRVEIEAKIREDLQADPLVHHVVLAEKYGVSPWTVTRWARKMGFPSLLKEKRVLNRAAYAKAAEMLAENPKLTYEELSKILGVSAHSLAQHFRAEHKVQRVRKTTTHDHARWAAMYERGMSFRRIAQMTGFHAETISEKLRERGVKRPDRTPKILEALALAKREGIPRHVAAMHVGIPPREVTEYVRRQKIKEKRNANPPAVNRGQFGRRDKPEDAGAGSAADADVGGPGDLQPRQGGEDPGRLADHDASEGQAAQQRHRRCG